MNVSIVIAAFDEAAAIGSLLQDVRSQHSERHSVAEILVYDDASTDATAEIVSASARADARIKLIRGGTRRGRAHARGTLIRAAIGDAVVALDADTSPGAGAVAALCEALERGASMSFGVCDPVCRRFNAVSRGAAFAAELVKELARGPRSPEFTVGRIFAVRRAAVSSLRIPSDIINDDHWISLRVRELGGDVVLAPDARCRFVVPDTLSDYRRQSSRIRAGERQLESVGGLRPLRMTDFIPALISRGRRDPAGLLCWAAIYVSSLAFVSRDLPYAEPSITSTKGGFGEPAGGGR